MKAFAALSTAATATHAIDTKTKELMALAISIAVHCDACVAHHAKITHQHGASRRWPSPFTWGVVQRRCMEQTPCAPTINLAPPSDNVGPTYHKYERESRLGLWCS